MNTFTNQNVVPIGIHVNCSPLDATLYQMSATLPGEVLIYTFIYSLSKLTYIEHPVGVQHSSRQLLNITVSFQSSAGCIHPLFSNNKTKAQ